MRSFKKYLFTLLLGFLIVGVIIWQKDLFSQTDLVTIFHILCDAFFVAGILITSFGLLIFSSNEGMFDMAIYGLNSFIDLFRHESRKKYKTFYEYRESRADKKLEFGFMPICGVFFLIVAVVMYLLYRKYS